MSLLDEHRAIHAPDTQGTASSRTEPENPFSLDSLPEGDANDLVDFASQFGGLRRVR